MQGHATRLIPGPLHPEARVYARSARSLTDAALVLYGVFGIIFLLIPGFLFLGVIDLVMLFIVYFTVRVHLAQGRVRKASTPALVLGIVSFFFGGIISAILLIIAYAKISSAEAAIATARAARGPLLGTVREGVEPEGRPEEMAAPPADEPLRYCPYCRAPLQFQYQYCTNCGQQIPG